MTEYFGKVYRTKEYSKFKRMEGNRDVASKRVKKIIGSIQKVGYIPSPILVNEKMQIVDGQARFEACKQLDLPVYYYVVEGLGLEECIALNINQTSWTLTDYIDSYAEDGNKDYINLKEIVEKYSGDYSLSVILSSLTGKVETPNARIKDGTFECNEKMKANASRILEELKSFKGYFDSLKNNKDRYYCAAMFCVTCDDVDVKRLLMKMSRVPYKLVPVANIQGALEVVEQIYNHHSKGEWVGIQTEYRKSMNKKYGWYEMRYGSLYGGKAS